jgi:hypothetical protein
MPMLVTLRGIVENGGNVDLSELRIPLEDIKSLLAIAPATGAQVIIHADHHSTDTLLELARLGGGHLTVKFD